MRQAAVELVVTYLHLLPQVQANTIVLASAAAVELVMAELVEPMVVTEETLTLVTQLRMEEAAQHLGVTDYQEAAVAEAAMDTQAILAEVAVLKAVMAVEELVKMVVAAAEEVQALAAVPLEALMLEMVVAV